MPDLAATWDLYKTFLAVMREKSLSGAAKQLGLAQPTVGRQIEKLEDELGVCLFVRSPRGLRATSIAHDLITHAETMASSAAALIRTASGGTREETGTIRLTAGEYIGLEVLPPMLAAFALRHPQIDLELSLTSRNQDLLQSEADIAVRMTQPTQKALVARRIGVVKLGLYAHRRYVEIAGLPKTLAELSNHRFIGFDRDFSILQSQAGFAATLRREDFRFRTDHVGAQIAAMRKGVGITACHKNIARLEPDLIPILADSVQIEREMWIVMHENARKTHRIRLMFDCLAEGLTNYVRGKAAGRKNPTGECDIRESLSTDRAPAKIRGRHPGQLSEGFVEGAQRAEA